jgi:hypothetical protein
MATQNPSVIMAAPDPVSNYNWINAISSALTALGVAIQGGVSGQINLSGGSVPLPGTIVAATTYAMGYEVRALVASGLPTIYVRVDYYLYAFNTTAAGLWPVIKITTGTGVNTSTGALTGLVSQQFSTMGTSTAFSIAAPTSARPLFFASDGANWLTLAIDPAHVVATPTATYGGFALERTITSATGAYNGDGWQFLGLSSEVTNAFGTAVVNVASSAVLFNGTFAPVAPVPFVTGSTTGTQATVFPVTVMLPKPEGPMLGAMGYMYPDIAPGTIFPVSMYGASHNYLALGLTQNCFYPVTVGAGTVTGAGIFRAAVRYE